MNTLMKLLTTLDSRLRGNDTFFQSVPSLSVIPAKLVLDSDRGAGIQELIDNLSIVDKQNLFSTIAWTNETRYGCELRMNKKEYH